MTFTAFIPTYNRPADLGKCLDSLLAQTRVPDEVLVVDDGALDESLVIGWRSRFEAVGSRLTYHRKDHAVERRGLSESKNLALQLVTAPIFFVLDDDVVLEPDFCERIMAVWEGLDSRLHGNDVARRDDVIGVGGIISNHRSRTRAERLFHRFFGLSSSLAWDVNDVGYQVWDEDITARTVGHYAHGGVCSYGTAMARELGFTTFSGGRTALEDVDFCARAKRRGWRFIIEPAARLGHYPKPAGREGERTAGRKESENRRQIFRTLNPHPTFARRAWFAWATVGWILRQLLAGHWRRAAGMAAGLRQ